MKFSSPNFSPHITIFSETASGDSFNNKQLSSDKKYCRLTFSDNGIGFEPEYKDRIFEIFQRLHSNEEYPESGIGLAICKKIVEIHRGIITATGTLNEGARFDFYIPMN